MCGEEFGVEVDEVGILRDEGGELGFEDLRDLGGKRGRECG